MTQDTSERRSNPVLREVVEDMIGHVRSTAGSTHVMSQEELDHAHERLEWLADEVWRAIIATRPQSA